MLPSSSSATAGKRTKLKFKGDDSSGNKGGSGNVLKKKRTTSSAEGEITTTTTTTTTEEESQQQQTQVATEGSTTEGNEVQSQLFEPKLGTGRFTSSGNILYGSYTKFMDELSPGDAIVITHPTSLREEMKVVRIVVSNISLSISSPFSSDLISTTPFRFIKAPKDTTKDNDNDPNKARLAALAVKNKDKDSEEYSSHGGQVFTYRSKKDGAFGGYKIVTEKVDSQKSREELLEMRSQKKSDRFCY